ncbi:MAG: UDP-4-amino-4,6-dideoxy-N-acetyl-beta-L-altrosamine transaminase [Proteobacteria bacterium]|nr:MAG: UDP-4-amino-4,6-dideoxy-N-acetyl-beta-L-altrosamine transaminase [Pseudomonadota bacterium]
MNAIPYGKQEILDEDVQAVSDALRSKFLTQGPAVAEFEKRFAEYVGSRYAVAVSNGTAALHLSALSLGVKSGQKVLCTAMTFAASANCIQYCGAEVEFVDIDPMTYCIDYNLLADKITNSPSGTYAGVIVVDFTGYPVDMEKIHNLTSPHGMWIIEDACHAPGGAFHDSQGKWQKCGNGQFADLAIFSFHPVKHIASGEGGAITTNDEQLYKKILLLRTHGITKDPAQMESFDGGWYYEMQELGYNYRLPDMLCALATSQLSRAEHNLSRRRLVADRYDRELAELPIKLPYRDSTVQHAFHLYVIQTERRRELYDFLASKNIFSQVHYVPVPDLPYYKRKGYSSADTPEARNYYEHCLSIPMFHSLTSDEQTYVIQALKEFF